MTRQQVREGWPPLTEKQEATWRVVCEVYQTTGRAPTYRVLMDKLEKSSSSTIHHQLSNLERLGYVHRYHGETAGTVPLRFPDGSERQVAAS